MSGETDRLGVPNDTNLKKVQQMLADDSSIEFIRLQWIDFTATVRTRIVTSRQALSLAAGGGTVSVASPIASCFLIDGQFHEVNAGAKDSLVPDWSSLTICHYRPGHAAVMCCIDQAGRGFDHCPRSILKKAEQEIRDRHGITFKVGIETEFYLTASPESTAPVKVVQSYSSTSAFRTPYLAILEDAVRDIEKAGIPIWTFHAELVGGLFELQTDPMSPLKAADALIYVQEAIKSAAVKHGLHATMAPKPFDKTHGVGQHIHISLSSGEKDDSFLAGVLSSVPAISAISMPNYDSWLRRDFAGGDWVGWDVESRTASIRKLRKAYWEFRFIDATTNTYLTLATILGLGMASWEQGKELKAKPMSEWPSLLDEKGRREAGVENAAPKDLKDAIEALRRDEAIHAVLGKEFCERYIRYKEHEEQMMGELTLQERRTMTMALF